MVLKRVPTGNFLKISGLPLTGKFTKNAESIPLGVSSFPPVFRAVFDMLRHAVDVSVLLPSLSGDWFSDRELQPPLTEGIAILFCRKEHIVGLQHGGRRRLQPLPCVVGHEQDRQYCSCSSYTVTPKRTAEKPANNATHSSKPWPILTRKSLAGFDPRNDRLL